MTNTLESYLELKPSLFADERCIRMDHLAKALGISSAGRVHDQVGRYWDYIGVAMKDGHLWIGESGIPIVARAFDTAEARAVMTQEDDDRALMDALCTVGEHIINFREQVETADPVVASLAMVRELMIEVRKVKAGKVREFLSALEALEEMLGAALTKAGEP